MLILKRDRKLKNFLGVLILTIAALAMDSTSSDNLVEARFLGTGKKIERTPCVLGHQWEITTITVLWIVQVGEPSYKKVPC